MKRKVFTIGLSTVAALLAVNGQADTGREQRLTFQAKVQFEKKHTYVPALRCRDITRCPKSQPYYALNLLPTNLDGLEVVEAARTPLGVQGKPRSMMLGRLRVVEGDWVEVEALLSRVSVYGKIEQLFRASSIASAPDEGKVQHLGAGYSCQLRDAFDTTYNQMKVYIVHMRGNRFDGAGFARLVADSSLISPYRNLIDTSARYTPSRGGARNPGIRVHTQDGSMTLYLGELLRATPRPYSKVTGSIVSRGKRSQLQGTCSYEENVIRQLEL